MATWRDLTAIVLLAHLVTLSKGNIDGDGAIKEILSKNVSVILIEDKANGLVDGKLINATSLTPSYNNFSMAPDTRAAQNEKIVEAELKEVLECAASSGQVILISPPARKVNSTRKRSAPEKAQNRRKVLVRARIRKSDRENDQETAQSQKRSRYDTKGNVEDVSHNLEDVLAIAEYEPQRIDLKRIESSDKINSEIASTSRPHPEETHYDVPKRRNLQRNLQRTTEVNRPTTLRSEVKKLSSETPSTALPIELQSVQTRRRTSQSNLLEYKAQKRRATSPFHQTPTATAYTESTKDPKGSDILTPLTTKSSLPRRVSYNSILRTPTTVDAPSSIDMTSPGPTFLPGNGGHHPGNVKNSTNTSESPKKYVLSSRLRTTHNSLPTTYHPVLQNRNVIRKAKSSETTPPSSVIPQASRRSDNYLTPDEANVQSKNVKSTNHERHPLFANEQLGFLTRYNLPSLLVRPTSLSAPFNSKKNEAIPESEEEKKTSGTTEISEDSDRRSSRTSIPVHDTYEEPSKPFPYNPRGSARNSVQDDSTIRAHPKTTPAYESYENDEEETAQNNHQVERAVYNSTRNLPKTSTSAYDSDEDYAESEKSKSVSPQTRLVPNEDRQIVTNSPYIVPINPTYYPYKYLGRTLPPVTPINIENTPVYQYHSLRNSPTLFSNTIYNPFSDSPKKKPASFSLERQTHHVPHESRDRQRIVPTTAAYESYEVTEETTRPPVTHQRSRNPNYVVHREVRPVYNAYHNYEELETTPAIRSQENSDHKVYQTSVNDPYTIHPVKPINHLPSRFSLNAQRNSRPTDGISPPNYVDTNDSNEDDGTNDSTSKRPRNQATRATLTPEYNFYEDNHQNVESNQSRLPKLVESSSANYGNRVKTRVREGQDPAPAFKIPGRHTVKASSINYEDRKPAPVHVDEEPIESVNRADVKEAIPYEDEEPASSGHEEKHHDATHEESKDGGGGDGGGDHKHEEGDGGKHEEDHHEHHDEKGEKGYKEWHEHDEGEKGHHDKEDHDKEYAEKKGDATKHEDESAYHKQHHHAEKGQKEAEFGEKGEHQKGHSTKGQHVVHKKDEYEKKTEFYDESHEEDGEDKEGEYHHEHKHEKGGHEKVGHYDGGHHEDKYGEEDEHEKGHHYHDEKGHDAKDGHDHHHQHEEKYGKKGGHEEGLKWSHKKGDDGGSKKKDS